MKRQIFIIISLSSTIFADSSGSTPQIVDKNGNTTVNVYEENSVPEEPGIDFTFGPGLWYGGYYGGPWYGNSYYYHDDHYYHNGHWHNNYHNNGRFHDNHEGYHGGGGHGGGHGR